MKTRPFRIAVISGIGAFASLLPLNSAQALSLGTAGPSNWALLEIGNGVINVDTTNASGNSAIWGNAGIGQNETLTMSGGSLIHGDLFLGNSANTSFSGGAGVAAGHSTLTNQDPMLAVARNDALNASSAAAALGGTPLTLTAGMTLTPGTYSLTNFSLAGSQTITLSGAGDYIFNISGTLNLSGTSQVLLSGGASASNVLYNITGTSSAGTSGGSILRGIILAPNADVTIDSGVGSTPHVGLFGEVISGRNITIASGSGIQAVPEPPVWAMMLTGAASLCAALRFRRRVN
jgi:hypothetical protein